MKKLILLALAVIVSVSVCLADDNPRGSSQKLSDAESYALKKPTRASGEGVSRKNNVAKQKAADAARSELSQSLEAAILAASKSLSYDLEAYGATDNDGDYKYEGGSRSNALTKMISQNVLKGTPIVKEDIFYNKKNKLYTVVVCVEYNGTIEDMVEDTVQELKSRLSDKDKARVDSELDKWERELTKELDGESSSTNVDDENV